MMGLTPKQEIVEVRINNSSFDPPKMAIERVLAEKPLHRIVSLSVTAAEEYATAAIILIVIEYLTE